MAFLLVVLHQILIYRRMWLVLIGMRCQGFGGIRLKGCPGQWRESRQRMAVSLGQYKKRIFHLSEVGLSTQN